MNEPAAKVSTPVPDDARRYTPDGYRSGIITAISVLVGFSLSFLRYWAFDAPQAWSWRFSISTVLMVASMLMQLVALFRSLQIEDHEIAHYRVTCRWLVLGVALLMVALVFAAMEVSLNAKGPSIF